MELKLEAFVDGWGVLGTRWSNANRFAAIGVEFVGALGGGDLAIRWAEGPEELCLNSLRSWLFLEFESVLCSLSLCCILGEPFCLRTLSFGSGIEVVGFCDSSFISSFDCFLAFAGDPVLTAFSSISFASLEPPWSHLTDSVFCPEPDDVSK